MQRQVQAAGDWHNPKRRGGESQRPSAEPPLSNPQQLPYDAPIYSPSTAASPTNGKVEAIRLCLSSYSTQNKTRTGCQILPRTKQSNPRQNRREQKAETGLLAESNTLRWLAAFQDTSVERGFLSYQGNDVCEYSNSLASGSVAPG